MTTDDELNREPSLMRCWLARRFTNEDWQSDEAKNALALAAFTLALAPAFAFAIVAPTFAALASAFAFAALAAFTFALAAFTLAAFTCALTLADSDPSSSAYFVSRFLGAYLHHRKRIKEVPE